jgi:hypothetical protein
VFIRGFRKSRVQGSGKGFRKSRVQVEGVRVRGVVGFRGIRKQGPM